MTQILLLTHSGQDSVESLSPILVLITCVQEVGHINRQRGTHDGTIAECKVNLEVTRKVLRQVNEWPKHE